MPRGGQSAHRNNGVKALVVRGGVVLRLGERRIELLDKKNIEKHSTRVWKGWAGTEIWATGERVEWWRIDEGSSEEP